MALLVLLVLTVALIWTAVLVRFRPAMSTGCVLFGAALAMCAGVVFGREFFALEIGPLPLTFDRLLLAATLGLGLYQCWRLGSWSVRLDSQDIIVLGWFTLLAANTLLTDWHFRDNLPLTRLLFLNLLPLITYFLLKHVPGASEWGLRTIAMLMMGLSLYLSVTAVAEWRGWHSLVFPKHILDPAVDEFLGRGRGPLQNPVINGMLMMAGWSCALVVLRMRTRGTTAMWIGWTCLISFGIVATLTRSVWFGAAASAGLVVWLQTNWRMRIVGLCGLLAFSPIVWLTAKEVVARFKRDRYVTAEEMEQSAALRPMFAYVAWKMFQERPITGFGFGQYQKHKIPFHYDERFDKPLQPALAYFQHNVCLSYLVDTGIVGLMALTALLVSIGWSSWRTWRQCSEGQDRYWGLVGMVVLVNYVINGMFHDTSIIPQSNMLLLFAAGAVARVNRQTESFTESGRRRSAAGVTDASVCAVGVNATTGAHP